MIKAIAFDLGGVIFDFDFTIALNSFSRGNQVLAEKILDDILKNGFTEEYEKGLITTEHFYQKFIASYGLVLDFTTFLKFWTEIFTPNQAVIQLLYKLKERYPLYLISNTCETHYDYLTKEFPQPFSVFNDVILSYLVHSVKPEEKIYSVLKVKADRDYEEILYIDDRRDLIENAADLGLISFQFKNHQDLIKQLEEKKVL